MRRLEMNENSYVWRPTWISWPSLSWNVRSSGTPGRPSLRVSSAGYAPWCLRLRQTIEQLYVLVRVLHGGSQKMVCMVVVLLLVLVCTHWGLSQQHCSLLVLSANQGAAAQCIKSYRQFLFRSDIRMGKKCDNRDLWHGCWFLNTPDAFKRNSPQTLHRIVAQKTKKHPEVRGKWLDWQGGYSDTNNHSVQPRWPKKNN